MEEKKTGNNRNSKTKIIPPKKKQPESLSKDEIRSINKKKIKRKRKARKIALLAALFTVVMSVGVVLVLAVFFKINTVTIKGDRVYSDKEIVLKSGIEIGDNLFRVNEEALNENLSKSLPYIQGITLERQLPDTLIVTVKATREVAAFQYGSGFILVNDDGKVLDRDASMLRDNVAVVNGAVLKGAPEGERIVIGDGDATDNFVALLKGITESGITPVTEITITKDGQYELKYDDRITVKLGGVENITTKLKRAVAALEKENEINMYAVGVLDLRTEPYAYFDAGEDVPATKPVSTTNKNAGGESDSADTPVNNNSDENADTDVEETKKNNDEPVNDTGAGDSEGADEDAEQQNDNAEEE